MHRSTYLSSFDFQDGKLLDGNRSSATLKSVRSSIVSRSKNDDIVSIHVRRGGLNTGQSHKDWISTIQQFPDVISMWFVPITSLLNGVQGIGFISHAMNLYLRHKPPIEELHQFLEFQLPRQWAPAFSELPLGPLHKKHSLPFLQCTFMGPKLHVNMVQVDSGNRPVTGMRLYLEGNKNNRLAIHLQHLSTLPNTFQLYDDITSADEFNLNQQRAYFEPIKWTLLSHVCTAPVQYSGACFDESAAIVTKAWLEVREIGVRKVLFLRLGFSSIASMRIRRSEWDGPFSNSHKSGSISALFSERFSTVGQGPDDLPGYWVVTGGKLCVENGKISLKVKYSLLVAVLDEDDL
uniref:MACPF domain-containing protein n=1 Tax=Ananas comosus var. bracteatus TaxID=296719 RepID=A0A6V7NYJ8_ANACO|nr:unnamed protein product [Ananas comosus var. bracteatus]